MWSSTPRILLHVVWALPISLATTFGIVIYFLFLWVMRCFSSPSSLHYAMYLRNDTTTLLVVSSLIRISTALCLFAAPRSFSQLVTSFFGAMYQGILLYALCSLIYFSIALAISSNYFPLILRLYSTNSLLVNSSYAFFSIRINHSFQISFSLPSVLFD